MEEDNFYLKCEWLDQFNLTGLRCRLRTSYRKISYNDADLYNVFVLYTPYH